MKESHVPVDRKIAVDILGYVQDHLLNVKASHRTAKAVQRRHLTSGAMDITHWSTSPMLQIIHAILSGLSYVI